MADLYRSSFTGPDFDNTVSSALFDITVNGASVPKNNHTAQITMPEYTSGTFTPVFGWVNTSNGYDDAGVLDVNYSRQNGKYIKIGDLCYVTFLASGKLNSNPSNKIVIGSFPFDAATDWPFQTLSLGSCAKLDSNNTQIWTPTPGVAARMVSNKDFALITQENGYVTIDWPIDTTNEFYFEGSGIYKIKA